MKRLLPLLLCLLLLSGCAKTAGQNVYTHSVFTASLPETFEVVKDSPMVCFAPYGDPLMSSSITFYSTELNWYFEDFTEEEYRNALLSETGYDELTLESVDPLQIDGYSARRIACKVGIDQGTHDLILYAVSADQIYFFTLLNREGDRFIEAFDQMMQTVRFSKNA